MMRAIIAAVLIATSTTTASAEGPSVFVVPGRVGVPIIVNGLDASYAVIESDYGLARGVRPQPVVYGGHLVAREPYVGRYFPSAGQLPGYGRLEIEPPQRPRRQAEFYRSWSAQSAPAAAQIPVDPPELILAQPGQEAARSQFPNHRVRGSRN